MMPLLVVARTLGRPLARPLALIKIRGGS